MQCALLRLATGRQRIRPIAGKVSKASCVLMEHMNQVGDMRTHSKGDLSVTMAASFCMAAIELTESLARDLRP